MSHSLLDSEKRSFAARAMLVGQRIDLRALGSTQRMASGPLVVTVRGGGLAVLFRYGALALFDVQPLEEDEFIRQLRPRFESPYAEIETEQADIRIDPEAKEVMEGSTILLKDICSERLQLVADVLCKSTVLSRYEAIVAQTFEKIEPFAQDLEKEKSSGRAARELLRHLGSSLLIEQQMVGRVQIDDNPDLLWDRPDLERLFARLRDEFEITERFVILNRKLELISRTVQTVLELLHANRSLRVEWYIVALIVLEIILTLYQLIFLGKGH